MYVCIYIYTHTCTYIFIYIFLNTWNDILGTRISHI